MNGDRCVPWVCAAVALLPTLVAIAATSGGVFTVDCGAKVLAARRLLTTGYGAFDLPYPGRRFDPDGSHFPVPPPYAVAHDGRFFSQYPVAFPALAAPFAAVFGPAGMRLPAALGLAACAGLLAAWLLPALGRSWALAGGLGLAWASPLSFYGVAVWEHAPTVALALLAQRLAERPVPGRLVAAGATIGTACWLREELFLVGLALAAALWWTRRRPADCALLAAGAAPVAAALLAFNAHHFGSLLGAHVAGNVGAAHAPSALGALRDLGAILAGYGAFPAEAWAIAGGVAACWIGGAVAVRRGLSLGGVLAAVAVPSLAAWLVAWLRLADASHPVLVLAQTNGFLLRMPLVSLAGAGMVLVATRDALSPLRFGVRVGAVFLASGLVFRVLFTDFLAGFHWGPRMLLPALPAFATLGLVALREGWRSGSPATRWTAAAAAIGFAAAGLASTAQSLWLQDRVQRDSRDLERYVLALTEDVVVTDHAAISQQLPEVWDEKTWLLARTPAELATVAGGLERENVGGFAVLARPGGALSRPLPPGYRCVRVERRQSKRVPALLDLDVHACRMAAKQR